MRSCACIARHSNRWLTDTLHLRATHLRPTLALRHLGVQHIVACGCKAHHPGEFRYLELHLSDHSNASIGRMLRPAADYIAAALTASTTLFQAAVLHSRMKAAAQAPGNLVEVPTVDGDCCKAAESS